MCCSELCLLVELVSHFIVMELLYNEGALVSLCDLT